MRSANLLNDFAFKYVFGEDCKEANDALKSLLTVFLERKVNRVVVKNSEIVKDYSKMKSPRLDLLVEFDDRTMVDLEMQLRQKKIICQFALVIIWLDFMVHKNWKGNIMVS